MHMDADADELDIVDGRVVSEDGAVNLALREIAALVGEQSLEAEASVMPGSRDYIVNSFGAHFAEVEVDTETGSVRALRYVAAHDSGRILNPQLATNQVEGGVSQMLGFTLSEEMLTDPHSGATLNGSFLEHKSPTVQEYPPIEVIFADVVDPIGPFRGEGAGRAAEHRTCAGNHQRDIRRGGGAYHGAARHSGQDTGRAERAG